MKPNRIRWSIITALIFGTIYLIPFAHATQARPPAQTDDATLLAPLSFTDESTVSFFGGAVAMGGDTLVIGATGAEIRSDPTARCCVHLHINRDGRRRKLDTTGQANPRRFRNV